jgi:hypothetical protein
LTEEKKVVSVLDALGTKGIWLRDIIRLTKKGLVESQKLSRDWEYYKISTGIS